MSARMWMVLGLLTVVTAVVFAACGGETAPAGSGGPVVAEAPTEPPPPPAPVEPRPSWDEPNFELVGTATGPFTVGTPGSFEVRLTPRGEYHVNREYPWTVTVTAPEGVTVPHTTLESGSAAEMTDTVARFAVPFTPTAAGTHHVVAAVDFGICTAEGCQFEMRNVAVDVVVN